MSMTYFALFYVAAIILFSVFVRLRLRKKRFLEEENKMEKNKPSSKVYDELAKNRQGCQRSQTEKREGSGVT